MAAHPLGGGLQYFLSALELEKFRLVDESERACALFHCAKFALADSQDTFAGWTNGRLWNGWAMPRFEQVEAQHLVEWLGNKRARYDTARDAFLTVSHDGEEEVWAAETILVSDGGALRVY